MNKLIAILTAFAFIFNSLLIASANDTNIIAADSSFNDIETIELGNGFTVEYEITENISFARSNTKTAEKTATCRKNGKIIATVTLTASFSYTGSSATCTSASAAYTMYDGWGYSNKSTTRSGNVASTSAKLSKGFQHANISISMKCSSTGLIS